MRCNCFKARPCCSSDFLRDFQRAKAALWGRRGEGYIEARGRRRGARGLGARVRLALEGCLTVASRFIFGELHSPRRQSCTYHEAICVLQTNTCHQQQDEGRYPYRCTRSIPL